MIICKIGEDFNVEIKNQFKRVMKALKSEFKTFLLLYTYFLKIYLLTIKAIRDRIVYV